MLGAMGVDGVDEGGRAQMGVKQEEMEVKKDENMESVTPPGEMPNWMGDVSGVGGSGMVVDGGVPRYMGRDLKMAGPTSLMRAGMVPSAMMMVPGGFSAGGPPMGVQGPSTYEMLMEQQKLNRHLQAELSKVRFEVEKLRETLQEYEWERQQREQPRAQTRYWTPEEHERFIDAVKKFGSKDVRSVASYVGTRNATQVRTHAQKYFLKIQKERKGDIQKNRRRCMSDSDLSLVEKRQAKEIAREDDGDRSDTASTTIQASPLSKHPSGIDLLSVAAEAIKAEAAGKKAPETESKGSKVSE